MLNELDKYKDYQIYLLNNGKFVLLLDVHPMTKIHSTEHDRRCTIVYGTCDNNKGLNDHILIVNDKETNMSISFDFMKTSEVKLAGIRNNEAKYIGTLTEEKAKQALSYRY